MIKYLVVIAVGIVLLRVCHGTPANPVYTLDTATSGRSLGYSDDYPSGYNADYLAAIASLKARVNAVHAALTSFTVAESQTPSQWASANAVHLATIEVNWPPSESECDFLCGEGIPSANTKYGHYTTGVCQRWVLKAHAEWVALLTDTSNTATRLNYVSKWYYDPHLAFPPYWTFSKGATAAPPIYMLNGFCTCRPGWGMSSDSEDAFYNTVADGPYGTWADASPADELTAGVQRHVDYTGSGRTLMGTLMTHDRMHAFTTKSDPSNVVLGFKFPMTCQIEVDQPITTSSEQGGNSPFDVRSDNVDAAHLITLMASTCQDEKEKGRGSMSAHTKKCFSKLFDGDALLYGPAYAKSQNLELAQVDLQAGHTFTECLPVLGNLNTQGWCGCAHGYSDSDYAQGADVTNWMLERPYYVPDIVSASFRGDMINDLYQRDSGCGGFHRFFCRYDDSLTLLTDHVGQAYHIASPRCDDYRKCNMDLLLKQGHVSELPYRMGMTEQTHWYDYNNHIAKFWTISNYVDIYNRPAALKYMGLWSKRPRTCHYYACTSPSHQRSHIVEDDGTVTCSCASPWYGDHCEIDGNAIYCNNHGTFLSLGPGFCDCDDDWDHTSTTALATDQCGTRCGDLRCNGKGSCTHASPTCVCDAYHTLPSCASECGAEFCNSRGNCTTPWVEATSNCYDCFPGFSGQHCHLNERWLKCSGHGTPVNTTDPAYASYEEVCFCDENYLGSDCSMYISPTDDACNNEFGDLYHHDLHNTKSRHSTGARRAFELSDGF